jgi:hypothetical protein
MLGFNKALFFIVEICTHFIEEKNNGVPAGKRVGLSAAIFLC